MHWYMYGFQWHFGVIFYPRTPYEATRPIILFTMYYFTAIDIILSLHYKEILNSIIISSIPYRTRQARNLSRRATQQSTTNINLWQFSVLNRSINATLTRFISRPTIIISFFLSSLVVPKITTFEVIPKWSHIKEIHCESLSHRKSRPYIYIYIVESLKKVKSELKYSPFATCYFDLNDPVG